MNSLRKNIFRSYDDEHKDDYFVHEIETSENDVVPSELEHQI